MFVVLFSRVWLGSAGDRTWDLPPPASPVLEWCPSTCTNANASLPWEMTLRCKWVIKLASPSHKNRTHWLIQMKSPREGFMPGLAAQAFTQHSIHRLLISALRRWEQKHWVQDQPASRSRILSEKSNNDNDHSNTKIPCCWHDWY